MALGIIVIIGVFCFLALTSYLNFKVWEFTEYEPEERRKAEQRKKEYAAFFSAVAAQVSPEERPLAIDLASHWLTYRECKKCADAMETPDAYTPKMDAQRVWLESVFAKMGIDPEPFQKLCDDPSISFTRKRTMYPYGPFKKRLAQAEAA